MAIQQHPVPQDISNYKFRLIGDMTIKQFASLGISIVLSVIIYSAPLPFFFKYPLSFTFLMLGVGMAFIPVQGRTLDIWIIAFIKSIYSPTQYVWKHGQEETILTTASTPTETANPNTPIVPISTPTAEQVSLVKGRDGEAERDFIPPISEPTTPTPSIPETPISVEIPVESPTVIEPVLPTPETQTKTEENITTTPLPAPSETKNTESQISAPTDTTLPIPFTPSTPNTLVGLTLTPDSHILEGVLIEIKNENLTLRATKSNKLGQFLFARPLENGLYQIIAEKEGFKFEVYSIELNGQIMNPLKIQATK